MKRFAFWFVAGALAVGWFASHRHPGPPPRHTVVTVLSADGVRKQIRVWPHDQVVAVPGRGVRVVRHDGRVVTVDGGPVRLVDRTDFGAGDDGDDRDDAEADFGRSLDDVREAAEGLPVPIVPGTRVTTARAEPPAPPRAPTAPRPPKRPRHGVPKAPPAPPTPPAQAALNHAPDSEVVTGRRSATEERAVADAVDQLRRRLAAQLAPRVPSTWRVPDRLIHEMVGSGAVTVRPVALQGDFGTVYEATIRVSQWSRRQAQVVQAYRQEEVKKRLLVFGGLLAFVLICLAALSGYIKTDEATKGYYTNSLRLAAAAAVGAAGTLLVHFLRS